MQDFFDGAQRQDCFDGGVCNLERAGRKRIHGEIYQKVKNYAYCAHETTVSTVAYSNSPCPECHIIVRRRVPATPRIGRPHGEHGLPIQGSQTKELLMEGLLVEGLGIDSDLIQSGDSRIAPNSTKKDAGSKSGYSQSSHRKHLVIPRWAEAGAWWRDIRYRFYSRDRVEVMLK